MNDLFLQRYEKLNLEQKRAVDTIEGPLLVVAGPGSGKTELLSLRVANILREVDVRPSNILCLTFTENAALNMRQRLEGLIGLDAYKVSIHTFHSFGTHVMGLHPEYFFGGASFAPADEISQLSILNKIFEDLPFDDPLRSIHPEKGFVYLEDVKARIGHIKRAGISPDEFKKILERNHEFYEKTGEEVNQIGSERISAKTISSYKNLLQIFKQNIPSEGEEKKDEDISFYRSIGEILAISLERALEHVEESGKTSILSEWKSDHISKEGNSYCLKSFINEKKMYSLLSIYERYIKDLNHEGYFDFDDMLLQVIQAAKTNETLRYELTEK